MKRRIISLIMATLLFLSVFSGYNEIFASEEKNNYIVHIDVESILNGYEQALRNEDFDKAITIAGEALDKFEASLKNVKHYEVYDRIKLLVPSLCIKASQDTINQIKLMPNVIDVYEDEEFYIQNDMDQNHYKTENAFKPMRIGSNDLIGNDSVIRSKYDGRGQVLAVIDGNMDPSHEAFYLSDGVKGKLSYEDIEDRITGRDGKITLEAKGNAIKKDDPWVNKVPFGYDYYNFSTSLNPEKEKKGHGEHVAGTMGGNRTKAFGEDWQGVAPNAQLLFLRCMHEGTTTPSSYIKASVDAVILGASAANLSLGSTKGLPGTVDKLLTNLIDTNYLKNTNFVIAAGNEGEFQGNMSIDNPDYGTISNPGIATNAITVASLENKTMYAYGLDK
uniref:S8 family serine peptidase n=1 Tax=Ezakiella massiliensis TaxID=1852374 RepID=UPI00094E9A2D|nr:S8 family serine peptidase [Ezakiella massiliensis]